MVIVGSGAGGGILAWELSRRGKDVVVVEAGPPVGPKDFRRDISHTFGNYFWDGGLRTLRGNALMPTLQGRCLGGTTVFNSAICMRPLVTSLERWQTEDGVELSPEDWEPHLSAVEEFMGVRPTPVEVQGRRNELFQEGCAELDWAAEPLLRNELGCEGSAGCIYGCENAAKRSTDRWGIRQAVDNGAIVYTSVTVDRLVMTNGRVRGVEGHVRHPQSQKKSHRAKFTGKCVVLAAGALATPQIMQRSGLDDEKVGSNLRLHPSIYAIGRFDEDVNPWRGATQGYHCTEFVDTGLKLESLWADASLLAERFPTSASLFQQYLKDFDKVAVWDAWVSGDDSRGRVRALPGGRSDFSFTLADADVRRLQEANAKLAELFLAAGAKEVLTGMRGVPESIRSERDVRKIRTGKFTAQDIPTGSNHVFGTTPMGGDPDRHVTDSHGAVYGVDDLYVCDTGLYPQSPGANPQLTVMALAHRLGGTLDARY